MWYIYSTHGALTTYSDDCNQWFCFHSARLSMPCRLWVSMCVFRMGRGKIFLCTDCIWIAWSIFINHFAFFQSVPIRCWCECVCFAHTRNGLCSVTVYSFYMHTPNELLQKKMSFSSNWMRKIQETPLCFASVKDSWENFPLCICNLIIMKHEKSLETRTNVRSFHFANKVLFAFHFSERNFRYSILISEEFIHINLICIRKGGRNFSDLKLS